MDKVKKRHGMTGKRNAAKPDADKKTGDRFYVTGQPGLKARCVRDAQRAGIKLNEWCREAFVEKLEKGSP